MADGPFQGHLESVLDEAVGQLHFKATVTADVNDFHGFTGFAGCQNGSTGKLLVIKRAAAYLDAHKALFGQRVSLDGLNISLQALDHALALLDLGWEFLQDLIFQPILLALVVCFQYLQPGHFDIQVMR